MTSSLFMLTLDNIRYEGDTHFVFLVSFSYDKILSNRIKILQCYVYCSISTLYLSLLLDNHVSICVSFALA